MTECQHEGCESVGVFVTPTAPHGDPAIFCARHASEEANAILGTVENQRLVWAMQFVHLIGEDDDWEE